MTRRLVLMLAIGATWAWAQRGADWMTSGFDAQRSHWVRNDGKISVATMSKPGFELVWKAKVANGARGLETSTPPALLDFYISYRGFRALGFFGTALDRVVAYDIDLGRVEWEKQWGKLTPGGTIPCPGGMTTAVTRPTGLAYPPVPTGGGAGRGNPAKSGVGEPYEGAVTLKRTPPPRPAPAPAPAAAAKPAPPAPNPYAARILYVLALSGDGKLHSLWVSNGNEPDPALQFLPPNARAAGLVSVDGMVYASTSNACAGVPDGVWAMDVAAKSVTKWLSKGLFGGAGPAIAPDGTVYAAGGDGQFTALSARTLAKKSAYQAGADFTSSPVLFEHKGKDFAALTTKDGRLHVVDTTTMSGQKSEPFSTGGFETGALASWQDTKGRRWILAPSNKSIVAFEVTPDSTVQKVWESRELVSPATPVIVNGVVFALSTGEHRTGTAAERVKQSKNAVLYALDGATGKELWNSGTTINGFVHSGGISVGGGRVYVAANDGTQYVFAFPMEH